MMQVLDPDILDLTRQLSPTVNLVAVLTGLALWLFGAHSHRFWLALVMTISAGIIGLVLGREFSVQPLVAGLLLALAAGMLALALTRITVFILGGLCAILLVRIAVPAANEFLCFVVGGLVGVCFYSLWITALSSLLGIVLAAYGLVGVLDRPEKFDSVAWSNQNAPLINWTVIGFTVVGILMQFLLDRWREKRKLVVREQKAKEKLIEKEKEKKEEKEKKQEIEQIVNPPPPWWHPRNLFGNPAA